MSNKNTVTIDGKPMEGVLVLFAPTSDGGMAASGTTDASGNFVLTTQINGDGALPGTYQIGLSKFIDDTGVEDTGEEIDPDDEAAMDALYGQLDKVGPKGGTSESFVAAKFNSPATSGLEATVAESGENNFTFEATSK